MLFTIGGGYDYSKDLTFEQLVSILYELGISNDGKKPMGYDSIKRKGEEWCRETYNAIKNGNNLVNISNIKGEDLGIVDTDKYIYVVTYSFPCQDLSLAGKQAGMDKGSGTSSSMLWEVERLLNETEELPQVLLMENVPQVHGKKNIGHFDEWIGFLESKGYKNYWKDLNAKHFGIPQNRNRCFMISVLGNYQYDFPKPFDLKLRLKDMLENEVDEKYFLSDKHIDKILTWKAQQKPFERVNGNNSICPTLTARGAGEYHSGMVLYSGACEDTTNLQSELEQLKIINDNSVFDFRYDEGVRSRLDKEVSPTITTKTGSGGISGQPLLRISEASKLGYKEAYEGDGVYINRPHQKRGVVQDGMIPTIKTNNSDVGVVVEDKNKLKVIGNYSPSGHNAARVVDSNYIAPTVMENHGTVTATVVNAKPIGTYQYAKSDKFMQGKDRFKYGKDFSDTLQTTPKEGVVLTANLEEYTSQSLRIRKLTPKECWRLMGFDDNDFDAVKNINMSDSQCYKQAGNSIVVNILEAIFKSLFIDNPYNTQDN